MRGYLVAVLIAAPLLFAAGCGGGGEMSLSEYRKSISDLHDGVAWDLGDVVEELGNLDFGDYYDLLELQEVYRGVNDIFTSAMQEAEVMEPPPQARALQEDLVDFYSEGADSTRELVNALGFFEAVLPMLRDVENLALPALAEGAGVPEIRAAASEDRKTMDGYLDELSGMEPPEGLERYRGSLAEFFRSIDEAVAAMAQAVTPEDRNPFLQFRQWYAAALDRSRVLWEEAMAYLRAEGGMVDRLIEEGKELAGRIQGL